MSEDVSRRSAMRLFATAGGMAAALGAGGCAPALPPPGAGPAVPAAGAAGPPARSGTGTGTGGAARIDALLEQLTLEEKTALLHGAPDPAPAGHAGHVPGVPRLGIPALRFTDGSAGVRVSRPATALPAPVLLASAFDPSLAREYGQVIGREGRALGQDVVLAPMANLIRTPHAGRNFETFSEDPRLTADLVGEVVRGIQDEGLIAAVKHFALNNQERGRDTVDVSVDEQTLRETELRGFEAAVAAGAGAVLGSSNKVNGIHACESGPLLDELLRRSWGFDGWVVSDWGAAHSTVAAIRAGLDMEMPAGTHFGGPLREAVRGGSVTEAAVDQAVHRILSTMDRFGLLAARQPARPPRDAAAGARVARKVATAGAVLLRNEHGTLPLTGAAARSIAVIGPTAQVPFVGGGGSSQVVPDGADAPLTAIRRRAGNGSTVRHALGEDLYGRPLPAKLLTPAADLEHREVGPGRVWTHEGTFRLAADDEWTLLVHYTGERPGVRLDGEELFPVEAGVAEHYAGGLLGTAPDGMAVRRRTLALKAGTHRLAVTASGGDKGQRLRLRHTTGAIRAADLAEAVHTAKAARSVVLFAYEDSTEGRDRTSLALPGGQERLIEAVTAANPRTTVVLNTPSATTMPWLSRTGAVLQMYYPGQEGAGATADVLFGDVDPGGRLTQTFPADGRTTPVGADPARYPGVGGRQEYSEGVHVGHRWYDAGRATPLFPFGHGLSYTTWRYEKLSVRARRDGLRVEFTVRNTGRRKGTDVAQVYVGPSAELRLDQPVRALAGYRRITLAPGAAQRITIDVDARALSSWDPERHAWVEGSGRREVFAGRSSRELPLRSKAAPASR
ncbi:glycoside hydrolase family 3 C-terminal domain-containing protein [Streptomyces sp. NRRL F-4428]|uniref:glycoside hydrolase family 3 C-terminal domain-containing protein n=1 Tax=Streptomyces sp. NRRL F-4428 TaxID=1609137 RepID=UPI0005ECF3C0|nr:glycoside hydrolase family 3 C-terminal domain-containing protein [Streptomyces sp. NRRL F-4428]KJK50331.1 glycosyl hydrolase family 3 [Streptomyces sp. NRRL F-4428]